MDIKLIDERVQAYLVAYKKMRELDILDVYFDGSIQVTDEFLVEIAKLSNVKYVFSTRNSEDFPFEVSLKVNNYKFFTICSEKEYKNIFGMTGLNNLPCGYITQYSTKNDNENFADHFAYYVIYGPEFRERTVNDPLLKAKYDFLKTYIFEGKEY